MAKQEKTFPVHIVASAENICNYAAEKKLLISEILSGRRILLLGRRNTGKTSLIQSYAIPEFTKNNPGSLTIFVDCMSVTSMASIYSRLEHSLTESIRRAYPTRGKLMEILESIKSLRPVISVDSVTGATELSLGATSNKSSSQHISDLFREISDLHKKYRVLLVFDEFQDIAFVKEAEAILRESLQRLPENLPVVITGSKTHMLKKMFAAGKAPFANWGMPIDLPMISSKDYQAYIQDRFRPKNLSISLEKTRYLIEKMQGIPEAINIICLMLLENVLSDGGEVSEVHIHDAVEIALDRFQSIFRGLIVRLSAVEEKVLLAIAKNHIVAQPRGKDFIRQIDASPGGITSALNRLEDDGLIFRLPKGYVVNDPLLGEFLRRRG